MLTCPNGHSVVEGQRFCGECGEGVIWDGSTPAAEPSPVASDEAAPSGRSPRWRWVAIAAAVVLIAAVIMTVTSSSDDKQLLTGTFALTDPDGFIGSAGSCSGTGGYDDFGPGMDVKVRNGDDKLIGTTNTVAYEAPELEGEEAEAAEDLFELLYGDACVVEFEVNVPPDEEFYTVEIGRRGDLSFSREELEEQDWSVPASLG